MKIIRLANPMVRAVLRSPAHRLLSGRLVLLAYRGRRTGGVYEIPLRYTQVEETLVVVALRPRTKLWWRSLVPPTSVRLVLRGAHLDAVAEVLEGEEREAARLAYVSGSARVERLTRDAAVVGLRI